MKQRHIIECVEKAQEFKRKGENKMKEYVIPFIGSKTMKYEDAKAYFEQAIKLFKRSKKYASMIICYEHIVVCCDKLLLFYDKGKAYESIGDLLNKKLNNRVEGIKYYKKAIDAVSFGTYDNTVSQLYRKIAEIYEEDNEYNKAIKYYEECLEYTSIQKREINEKIAELSIYVGNYEKSLTIYEKVCSKLMNDSMGRIICERYFYNAGLALFCSNKLLDNINKYNTLNALIACDKGHILYRINNCIKNNDIDGFEGVIHRFVKFSTSTPLQKYMINIIRDAFENAESSSSSTGLR